MPFSSAADFQEALDTVRESFAAGITKNKQWRRHQLKRLWWMVEDNKDAICMALYKDLHKHRFESVMTDCAAIQNDIIHTLSMLDRWTADEKPARTDFLNFIGGTTVRKEPLGVSLIIGAWNYPMLLLLQPLIAALAAGCAVILKPSDVAVESQELLMRIVPEYLDQKGVQIISAGPQEMTYILQHRFNHIFFTGSAGVAKIVHAAASKHLTPVTLELGGQGPAIVCKSANIEVSARRIAATKFMNAGQICLNVNHVLVDPAVKDELVARLGHYFEVFIGESNQEPSHYTSIINERNFDRLDGLLQKTKGQVVYGGNRNRDSLFFSPTIVLVDQDDILLSSEIFGPILPVLVADLDTALRHTAKGEHPLAIYAFTSKRDEKQYILDHSMSGGVTFNDCFLHAGAKDAPFGGVGESGMGYYHGPHGILAFSHLRTYMNGLPAWMESAMAFRYPPYQLANINKMSPTVRPSFDREGNDVGRMGALMKLAAGLAGLTAVYIFRAAA
ncbi:hypothetical protein BDW75DRAFT_245791 [Aspergillus navahoensis]